ncbi:MAG: type II toxin-antitoxin system VapC family toxin [Nocardioides sp.]|uniref:type II toxin-antitoxin system VapC family toxin n=1 Tax=Nocardioides sp. TaxID=35761 RepID=UPI0039E4FDDE
MSIRGGDHAEDVPWACDTSVLVPALLSWHADHDACREEIAAHVTAVPAHVLMECYSVLTRLPAPHRLDAAVAGVAVGGLGLRVLTLSAPRWPRLISQLAQHRVVGGAVYDGLVAATAAHHGFALLTRDQRARTTYGVVGATYRLM